MKSNPLKALNLTDAAMVILPHIKPDGDTLGSAVALYEYLKTKSERVWIVLDDPIPFHLSFLNVPALSLAAFQDMNTHCDHAFALDSSDLGRLDVRGILLQEADVTINIDHHKTNLFYADHNVVMPEASSTGEVIYDLIVDAGGRITPEIAQAVYVAISSDTGSFKYSNTSSKTMRVASALIDAGIDLNAINTALYQNKPLEKTLILKAAMQNFRLLDDGRLALSYITRADMTALGIQTLDTDGVAEYFRDIQGVEVVILLKEEDENVFKASTRAKHDFDVSDLCLKHGGGGHAKAAGATVQGTLQTAIDTMVQSYFEMVG